MATTDGKGGQIFTRMWEEAQSRFEAITKTKLVQENIKTLDDVLTELETRFNGNNAKNGHKQRRVKELVSNVLVLIQVLGGITAQGASAVFGPTNLCFNAITFLIAVPAKISRFYDDLELLLEKVSTFLQQFKIYRRIEQFASVDVALQESTHKLMIVFVDICALSIDILSGSRSRKMKTIVRISLFDDDSGISAKLEEFQRLIDDQSRVSDAITLEHVLKSEHELTSSVKRVFELLKKASEQKSELLESSQKVRDDLKDAHDDVKIVKDFVVTDANDRCGERNFNEQLSHIRKKLTLPEQPADPEKDFEEIRNNTLADTGQWLETIDTYKRWIDLECKAHPLLLLSGSTGSGKSHLASAVLENLRAQYRTASSGDMRVSLACYRFLNNEKSRDCITKLSQRSKSALKLMAWQIAQQNMTYAKNLSSHLETKDASFMRNLPVKDLAQELLFPTVVDHKPNMAFFLILDGLDQLTIEEASELLGAVLTVGSPTIRSVITATEDAFRNTLRVVGKSLDLIPEVQIQEENEVDIKQYVEAELDGHKTLRGDAPGIERIKELIRERLPAISKGNYNNAKEIITNIRDAIESEQPEAEIIELISPNTVGKKERMAERLLNDLSNSLNDQEVEQLQELLIWTIYAEQPMSIDRLKAALFLRTKRVPLQSLEDKLKEKYSKVLEIRLNDHIGNKAVYANADITDFLRKLKRVKVENGGKTANEPSISMTINVNNVKLSTVRRFFWDLSELVVLDKFAFTEAFGGLKARKVIGTNKAEGHLALTRRCLDILLDEPVEETKVLSRYALACLPRHLEILMEHVDNGVIELVEREDIISRLVNLLQSADCLEKHIDVEPFNFYHWRWLIDPPKIEIIYRWLCDSEARRGLNRKDRTWLTSKASGGKVSALMDIAVMTARRWLCDRRWEVHWLCECIWVFLDQSLSTDLHTEPAKELKSDKANEEGAEAKGTNETLEPRSAKEPASLQDRILQAAEWATKAANITERTSVWFERLGTTYLFYGQFRAAREALLTAKALPDCSWKTSESLANAYAAGNELKEAVQEMRITLAHLMEKEDLTAFERDNLAFSLRESAEWQARLGETSDAIEMLQKAISINSNNHQNRFKYLTHLQLLRLFVDTGRGPEAMKFLDNMRTQIIGSSGLSQLESMLLEFSSGQGPSYNFKMVCTVTWCDDLFPSFDDSIQNALAHARYREETFTEAALYLLRGMALACREDKGLLDLALESWRKCCKLAFQYESFHMTCRAIPAAEYILNYHFSKARSQPAVKSTLETIGAELKTLAERIEGRQRYSGQNYRLSVGSFYVFTGMQKMAQKLLLNDMKSGIDLLCGDNSKNDQYRFPEIANILTHTGDDLNALSAWSLWGPEERYDENSDRARPLNEALPSKKDRIVPWTRTCDGRCGKKWTYLDNIWFCKVCSDIQFDDVCLEKLHNGALPRFVCSPDHEFLYVPSWMEEFRATGKGRVRSGGTLQDGKRVGGSIVPVIEWLNNVREKWGMERLPTKASTKVAERGNETAA